MGFLEGLILGDEYFILPRQKSFIWWVGESFGDLFKTKKKWKMKNGELEREAHGGVGWGGGGLPKSSQEIQVMSAMVPFSWCEIMCAYHILSRWGSGGKERAISFWFPFKICFPWPLDVWPIPCCVFMDVSFIHSFIHPYFFSFHMYYYSSNCYYYSFKSLHYQLSQPFLNVVAKSW